MLNTFYCQKMKIKYIAMHKLFLDSLQRCINLCSTEITKEKGERP